MNEYKPIKGKNNQQYIYNILRLCFKIFIALDLNVFFILDNILNIKALTIRIPKNIMISAVFL